MNKIIVAGSINMDIITRVSKLPLPGETVHGKSVEYLPGGKGLNQAVACAKMGAETILVSRLGNDIFTDTLRKFITCHHINASFIGKSAKESGTAFITIGSNGQNTIVVVPGSNADVDISDFSGITINPGDIIVCQFEIPLPTVLALFQKAKQAGARTILNPSPIQILPPDLLSLADMLIINETELGFLKGQNISDQTPLIEIIETAQKIKTVSDQIIIVTLGSRGALLIDDSPCLIESPCVSAIDTVGAGDCFAGVIASQWLNRKDLHHCVQTANHAASICVTRKGAAPSMPEAHELK